MAQLKVLVVEDDPLHLARINYAMDQMDYKIVAVADNGEHAMRMFKAVKPDLVLMDINIKGDKEGIEIAEQINQIEETPVIFTTSFKDSETIKRAVATNPSAYLIKPIEQPQLLAAMEMALFKQKDTFEASMAPKEHDKGVLLKKSLFIKTTSKIEKIDFDDIIWIESSEEKYLDVVISDSRLKIRSSIKQLIGKLDPDTFVQINQSQIINIHKLESISDINNTLTIRDRTFSLGKAYKKELLERIQLIN